MKAREAWLLRNGLAAALLALAWNTVPIRPLRVLVVLIHEIFHALASLVSGGGVLSIEVLSYSSGVTTLAGGSPLLVYSAGYLGTALLGSVLLAAGPLARLKRFLYLGVGVLVLAGTLLAVRNPFGWAYGLAVGVLLAVLFFREYRFSGWLADFLGVLCLVDVLHDLAVFSLFPSKNDASILSQSSRAALRRGARRLGGAGVVHGRGGAVRGLAEPAPPLPGAQAGVGGLQLSKERRDEHPG